MPTAIVGVVVGVLALVVGALIGQALRNRREKAKTAAASADADRIVAEAQTKEKELLLEAKEESIRIRGQAETEAKELRQEVLRLEQRVAQRDENLDRKQETLDRRDQSLAEREKKLDEARQLLEELQGQRVAELDGGAHLTQTEARTVLMTDMEAEIRDDANRLVRQIEEETRETAGPRAREILTASIQRLAREVGRGGRTTRALEHATGVDLIIDDTPDAVMLSSFDGVRREVARLALTRLISDGRIHPTRTEEVVGKSRQG